MEESAPDVNAFGITEANSSRPPTIKAAFDPNALYYDMRGNKFLFIFNHYEYEKTKYFDNHKPTRRNGTCSDVQNLNETFKSFDFKVKSYTDLKYDELFKKVESDIIKIDHTNTSCICIAILTHGNEYGEVYAKDRPYPVKELMCMLEQPKFTAIPKLFLIQACRGGRADGGVYVEYDGTARNIIHVPSHIDFLVLHSSVDGFASYRGLNGSWMIQALCNVIDTYHRDFDILQLITLVNNIVAIDQVSNSPRVIEHHLKKQTVEARYTLTKFFKFMK